MRSSHRLSLLLLLASLATASLCQAQEDTLTLPQGISRFRIVGVQTAEVRERFNAGGKLEPLAHSLNRSVTVSDLVARQPQLAPLIRTLNTLQPGMGDQLMNSNLYADSRTTQRITMPAYEYGISSNLNFGVRVPVVTRDSRNSFRAEGVNNSQALSAQACGLSPQLCQGLQATGSASLDSKFFEHSLFTSKGYEAPHDFHKTELGDIESGLKYNLHRNSSYAVSTQWGMRFPTGSTPSLTHVFDRGSGGGSLGTGLSVLQDVSVTKTLILGSMLKGFYAVPDRRTRAVPRDSQDSLPSLRPEDGQVHEVTRRPGLQFDTELALTANLLEEKLQVWSAYQYAVHGRDEFEGPGALYYEGLSRDTNWWKTNLELGTSFSTIPWFRAKKFPVPGRLNLIYSNTLAGVNTPLAEFIRTDLILFF